MSGEGRITNQEVERIVKYASESEITKIPTADLVDFRAANVAKGIMVGLGHNPRNIPSLELFQHMVGFYKKAERAIEQYQEQI